MEIKELNNLIECIKVIDIDLDAYEYNGYTYEQYKKAIERHERGNNSIRKAIMYNSGGMHIWSTIMDNCLNQIKDICNKLYLENKNKYKLNIEDNNNIKKQTKLLESIIPVFYKNTDKLSMYPIQSERIYNNLINIRKILLDINN